MIELHCNDRFPFFFSFFKYTPEEKHDYTNDRVEKEGGSAKSTHSLNKTLCCGHIPKYFRMLSMSVWMSYPLMRAVPDVGGNSPVRMDLRGNEDVNQTRNLKRSC